MTLEFSFPDYSSHPDFDNHEKILKIEDRALGLKAFIAIHSTQLGPARGGCRYWSSYANEDEALKDALRLSRGMTYKNTLAGLPHGGGKTVIMGVPGTATPTRDIMLAIGHALNELDGIYETGEDVGTSQDDFLIAREITEHVRIRDPHGDMNPYMAGDDPSPYTAHGIYCGIKAALKHKFGNDNVAGFRFAVKGLGHVSTPLCETLHRNGAELFVSDIDDKKVQYAVTNWGATPIEPDKIMSQDVDVYCPCALGGDVNPETIHFLQAKIVAGAANNQLSGPDMARQLFERGILYAPDYAINAGGVINVVMTGIPKDIVMYRVTGIYNTLLKIFQRSDKEGKDTAEIADTIVEERLAGTFQIRNADKASTIKNSA